MNNNQQNPNQNMMNQNPNSFIPNYNYLAGGQMNSMDMNNMNNMNYMNSMMINNSMNNINNMNLMQQHQMPGMNYPTNMNANYMPSINMQAYTNSLGGGEGGGLGGFNQMYMNNPNMLSHQQSLPNMNNMAQSYNLNNSYGGYNNSMDMNNMNNINYMNQMNNMYYMNSLRQQQTAPNMNLNNNSMQGFRTKAMGFDDVLRQAAEEERLQNLAYENQILEEIKKEKQETLLVRKDLDLLQEQKTKIELRSDIEVFIPQSEVLYSNDRFFFEELVLQPLQVAGCLGNNTIYIDKTALFDFFYDNKIKEQAEILKNNALGNNYNNNKDKIKRKFKNNSNTGELSKYRNNDTSKEKQLESQQPFVDKSTLRNPRLNYTKDSYKNIDDYFYDTSRDGVYLDIIKKQIFSYNLQKVEQRCLREKNYDWFKYNGDIRLDTDIFSENMTRPIDISLSNNDKFDTHYLSSFLTDRSSSRIQKSFKLKLFISKLSLENHPLFTREDVLNAQLKRYYNEFYERMNTQNISHYIEKTKLLRNQLDYYNNLVEKSKSIVNEEKYLLNLLEDNEKKIVSEKKKLKELGKKLYDTWLSLKQERRLQGFNSTTSKLSVLKFDNDDKNDEYNSNIKSILNSNYGFILQYIEPTILEERIPLTEKTRRKKLQEIECFAKIYINGLYSGQTEKKFVNWPSAEIDFNELICMNVYTRPSKIELELHMNNGFDIEIASRFEIEAPGIFMNSVTSSSALTEKIRFNDFDNTNPNINYNKKISNTNNNVDENKNKSKNEENNNIDNLNDKDEERQKLNDKNQEIVSMNNNTNKDGLSNNLNNSISSISINVMNNLPEELEKEQIKRKVDNKHCSGTVLVKAEWANKGPDMPPSKIEGKLYLLRQQIDFHRMIQKYNKFDFPFDINDPRNQLLFAKMKKLKTELMLKYFLKEIELPFCDMESARHALLKGRTEKATLEKLKIPLLEMEIQRDIEMRKRLDDLKRIIPEEDEETLKEKIKTDLKNLEALYTGKEMSEENFKEMVDKKIRLLKTDVSTKSQLSYDQVVREFQLKFSAEFLKNILSNIFSTAILPARKLKPKRKRKEKTNTKDIEEITINVHVVKGYNVPIRETSTTLNKKEDMINKVISTQYKSENRGNFQSRNLSSQERLKITIKMINDYMRAGENSKIANNQLASSYNANNFNNLNNQFGNMGTNQNSINYNVNPIQNKMMNNNLNNSINSIGGGMNNMNMNNLNNMNMMNMMNMNNNMNMMNNNAPYRPPRTQNNNSLSNYSNFQQPDGGEGDLNINLKGVLDKLNRNVESFMEIKLVYYDQEVEIRTDSLEGVHPDYNHKHSFKIKPKDEKKYFTKEEIQECPGGINFTLFDEIRNEDKIEERDSNTYIYKYEKRYLGNFFIPFSTIFQNAAFLETMSKVKIPLSVSGYFTDNSTVYEMLDKLEHGGKKTKTAEEFSYKVINPNISTYISLFLSVDPVSDMYVDEEKDFTKGFEDPKFLINSNSLIKKLKGYSLLSNRYIRAFADNFSSHSVFICRFINPQEPPQTIFDKENNINDPYAIEKASRYVALIPFLEDCQAFDEMPECWCTDLEFMNLKFGDYEEHAILLCNYFNYIDMYQNKNIKSHLILGKGHPEGFTTYVIRCNNDTFDYELWNAKTGECTYFDKKLIEKKCCGFTFGRNYASFNISDTICQLKEVGCIVTSENIYINVQSDVNPSNVDFNLLNKSNWKEFLSESAKMKYFPNGISTVQKPIDNFEGSPEDALGIQVKVFNYIKRQ